MVTPNTPEGELTELIMRKVRNRIPELLSHYYNPIWSAVLETLNEHLPNLRRMSKPLTRDEFRKGISGQR